MNNSELEIIEKWQADPSFINWVNNNNEVDIAKWNAYFDRNPQHSELAEVAKFSMELKPQPIIRDKEKSLAALSNLQNKIASSTNRPSTKVRKLGYSKIWQVAASLLIIAACFWGYSTLNNNGEEIIIATQEDQKEVNLADGTKVILNAHSTLKYYEKNVRNVELNGEAYFEVNKQPKTQAPFQVKTKDLMVTVLGTEFNVDSKNEQTRVYLDEGKVSLSLGENSTNEIEMQPGELVSYSKKRNKVLENKKVNSLTETAWKEKVILFKDASITKALQTVSLVYSVKFESNIADSTDHLFTGGIPTNDLDITLQTLKDVYQINIKKIEEKYIIK